MACFYLTIWFFLLITVTTVCGNVIPSSNNKPKVWVPGTTGKGKFEFPTALLEHYFTLVNETEVAENPEKAAEIVGAFHIGRNGLFDQLDLMPNLKYIQLFSSGYDYVPLQLLTDRGIQLSHLTKASAISVSELAFALMASAARKIPQLSAQYKQGDHRKVEGTLLSDKTIGIVGLGNIGYQLAVRSKAFNMHIKYFGRHQKSSEVEEPIEAVFYDDLKAMLSISDFVVIACPLNKESENMISTDEFNSMKKNAIIINIARGQIIDTEAMTSALNDGVISGAALDVTYPEPLPADHPLTKMDNVILTPHIGASTPKTTIARYQECIHNMKVAIIYKQPFPNRVL